MHTSSACDCHCHPSVPSILPVLSSTWYSPISTQNMSVPCSSSTLLLFTRLLPYGTFSDSQTLSYRFWKQQTSFHKVIKRATVNAWAVINNTIPQNVFFGSLQRTWKLSLERRLKHLRKEWINGQWCHVPAYFPFWPHGMALPWPRFVDEFWPWLCALVSFCKERQGLPSTGETNKQKESKAKSCIKVYSRTWHMAKLQWLTLILIMYLLFFQSWWWLSKRYDTELNNPPP